MLIIIIIIIIKIIIILYRVLISMFNIHWKYQKPEVSWCFQEKHCIKNGVFHQWFIQ